MLLFQNGFPKSIKFKFVSENYINYSQPEKTRMAEARPHLVFKKSEHARWRLPAHHGMISCMYVRSIPGADGGTAVVFTASADGHFKVWDGKDGRLLTRSKVSDVAILCMAVSDKFVCASFLQPTARKLA
jgi:hypothetical protein